MKNSCKHKDIETLYPYVKNITNCDIQWCKNCGARRIVAVHENTFQGTIRRPGRWKSPKQKIK